MQRLRPNEFVIKTKEGHLGLGLFPKIHCQKREGEHILKQVGIEVEFGEEIDYEIDRGTHATVGDMEHTREIIYNMDQCDQPTVGSVAPTNTEPIIVSSIS